MKYYQVKTFFQIAYYIGWGDKNPRFDYVRSKKKYYVKSEKEGKELNSYIRENIREKTAILFELIQLGELHPNFPALTESELIEKLKGIKIVMDEGIGEVVSSISNFQPTNSVSAPLEEDSNNQDIVYVTNATAASIAYKVCLFLNRESGRKDILPDDEQMQYWKNKFIGETAEFIEICTRLNLNIDRFVDSLTPDERMRYFKEKLAHKIKDKFRYIYHTKQDYTWLHSDYVEGITHHVNTGVFDGYNLSKEFLDKLGFRGCNNCVFEIMEIPDLWN